MSKYIKKYLVNILIILGIFEAIKYCWQILEIAFDGGVQPSISDSYMALFFTLIIWFQIKKWININEEIDTKYEVII